MLTLNERIRQLNEIYDATLQHLHTNLTAEKPIFKGSGAGLSVLEKSRVEIYELEAKEIADSELIDSSNNNHTVTYTIAAPELANA